MRPQQTARDMVANGTFVGGPLEDFEAVGRRQLMVLLREGLYPSSKVLDIGCGCLRGGYWLIHFLDPGCYCGIEPNQSMLQSGIENLLEPGLLESERPRFDGNTSFDTSVFGEKFDFFIARSVWTHAAKAQIETMLDGFVRDAADDAVFLASYRRASLLRPDYTGEQWMGRSHVSDTPGTAFHKLGWIREQCRLRGLGVTKLSQKEFNWGKQRWLRVHKRSR